MVAAVANGEWRAFIRKRMPATGSVITICHYYKLPQRLRKIYGEPRRRKYALFKR